MTLKDLAVKDLKFQKCNLKHLILQNKTLNIEVGERLTKVCVSVVTGKGCKVLDSFLFQTPDGAVENGQILDTQAFVKALREQLKSHELQKVKNTIFILTSGKIATREVTLPPVKESRLKDVVRTNASDYFPVDLTNYHVAYSLLERVNQGENAGCRVLVLAVPLQLLQPYFQVAAEAGLKVRNIDFSGNSQYQALRAIGGDAVTMYADIGCGSSCITFMQGKTLLLQRTFLFGGDEMVFSYMRASGKKDQGFLAALKTCSSGEMKASDLSESLSRLVENIVRSADYFNSNHWNKQVEKVVLMGSCSRLAGLREMVANSTGLKTSYLDDVSAVCSFDGSAQEASFYFSCIGSNLAPVDLVPPQFRTAKRLHRRRERSDENDIRDGILICGVCLAAAILLSSFALIRYHMIKGEKAMVESQIAKLAYTEKIYNTYVAYKKEEKSLQTLSDSIHSPNDDLSGFINDLEEKMPAQILLLSAACGQDSITMNITVPDYESVAMVLVQLREFQSIKDISISSVTRQLDESGGTYVSFSLTCTYGENPYLNGINPYVSKQEDKEKISEENTFDSEKD